MRERGGRVVGNWDFPQGVGKKGQTLCGSARLLGFYAMVTELFYESGETSRSW